MLTTTVIDGVLTLPPQALAWARPDEELMVFIERDALLLKSVARVRLLQAGKPVAERALRQEAVGLATIPTLEQATDTLTLRWGAPETPALVRYTVDGGASWTTVGLDVLGAYCIWIPRRCPWGEVTLRFGWRIPSRLSCSQCHAKRAVSMFSVAKNQGRVIYSVR